MDDRKRPVLSNVIVGRNDDHGGHYLERLQTTLNFLGETLRGLGRLGNVEVVYVDWGSDDPVADHLNLVASAASIVRFIEVPARDVRERWARDGFFSTLAVNVGVRRAAGEFVMLTDSDCMLPKTAMGALLMFLEGELGPEISRHKLMLPIRRYQVPNRLFARRPSLSKWAEILERLLPGARHDSPGTGCLGGFSAGQLMHRDLWHEFRGYNEKLTRPWGWSDNELMIRVTSRYDWLDLVKYGVMAFHIEHGEPRKLWSTDVLAVPRDPNRINRMRIERHQSTNEVGWGLADATFQERRAAARLPTLRDDEARASAGLQRLRHGLIGRAEIEDALRAPAGDRAVSQARDHCLAAYRRDATITERKLIPALAAFIAEADPVNMVYWGKLSEPVLYAALVEHTAIQAYLVNSWAPGDADSQQCDPGRLSQILEQSAYRGYARLLTGEEGTVLRQLSQSDPGFHGVELAIISDLLWGETASGTCKEVLRRLVPGGAMFVTGREAVAQVAGWNEASWEEAAGIAESARLSHAPADPGPAGTDVVRTTLLKPEMLALVVRQPVAAAEIMRNRNREMHTGAGPWIRSTLGNLRRNLRSRVLRRTFRS